MIDVKEANETEAQKFGKECLEKAMKRARENSVYGLAAQDTFRDPAEMVTISADRFEKLVRMTERLNRQLCEYEEMLDRANDFINTVAREWAEKGSTIPSYEDMSRMAVILGWQESYEIRDIRTTQRMLKDRIKKEAANNGEATD